MMRTVLFLPVCSLECSMARCLYLLSANGAASLQPGAAPQGFD